MKRIFLILAIFVSITLASVGGVALWAWYHPKAIWDFAETHLLPQDLQVNWGSITASFKSLGGLNFRMMLHISDLKIVKQVPEIFFLIDEISLDATVYPLDHERKICFDNFHVVSSQKLRYRPDPHAPPAPEKNPFEMAQTYLGWIRQAHQLIRIENADLDLPELAIESNEGERLFSLRLIKAGDTLHVAVRGEEPDLRKQDRFEFALTSDLPWPESATPGLSFPARLTLRTHDLMTTQEIAVTASSDLINVSADGSTRMQKIRLENHAQAQIRKLGAELDLTASGDGFAGPIAKFGHVSAHLSSPFESGLILAHAPSEFRAQAPIDVFFVEKSLWPLMEKACECKIPQVLMARIKGQAWLERLAGPTSSKLPVAHLDLALDRVDNALLSLRLGAHLDLEKNGDAYSLEPILESELSINSFKRLAVVLSAKNVIVPAPFDVLDGKISVTAHGPAHYENKYFLLPIQTSVRLASRNQIVDADITTALQASEDFKIVNARIEALINQLRLEAPPLTPLGGRPRVLADRRIQTKPRLSLKASPKIKLTLAAEVKTAKSGAIQVLSDYFQPDLPLTVKYDRTRAGENIGFVQAEPFDLSYLRRKMHVESMRIDLPPKPNEALPVKGRLTVQQTEYKVFIDIQGTVNHPIVNLSSYPDLPEDDIVSVLLYDRTRSELGSSDAAVAGNFQAALADRAIGLFGLWAFASTPIKSFLYDPTTHVYSATIALSNDLTAGIGTDWEQSTQVELRKRVSQNWILMATWLPATTTSPEQSQLEMTWERRY